MLTSNAEESSVSEVHHLNHPVSIAGPLLGRLSCDHIAPMAGLPNFVFAVALEFWGSWR